MTSVSVVIPARPTNGERARNLAWILDWYDHHFPTWQVIVTHDGRADGELWNKAAAINAGIAQATGDVVVVSDADVIIPPADLAASTDRALTAPWCVPHSWVHRLSTESTTALVAAGPTGEPSGPIDGNPQTVCAGGGLVIARRTVLADAGGPDPRFEGWGYEDSAWGYQLDTLAGPHHQGDALMHHLWHPPGRHAKAPGRGSQQLRARYADVRSDPALMRALIEERP